MTTPTFALRIAQSRHRVDDILGRTYKRDKDGKFSSGGGGGATGQAALDAVPHGTSSRALSADERKGLRDYKAPDHFLTINGSLRGEVPAHAPPAGEHTVRQIATLDAVMAGSRTSEGVQVWRGLQGGADRVLGADRMAGDLTGVEWRESGFMSTSVRQSAAQEFTQSRDAVLMRMSVPKGTGAAKMADREWDGEGEVLLQRGLRLRVTADHGIDPDWGYRALDVEVVPE